MAADVTSVIEAASQRPAVIDGTRHIGTVITATEDTRLSVFGAPDPETVAAATEAAGLPADRMWRPNGSPNDRSAGVKGKAMPIYGASARWTLFIVAVLVGAVVTGCAKSTPGVTTTPRANGSTVASSTAPPLPSGNPTGYCALAEAVATQSGVMVNKHFIPLSDETLDMFKAVVTLTLAAKDQMQAALPNNIRPAFQVVMQYFQALKDSNYSAAPPSGFVAANKTVNEYGETACGFVFDK